MLAVWLHSQKESLEIYTVITFLKRCTDAEILTQCLECKQCRDYLTL